MIRRVARLRVLSAAVACALTATGAGCGLTGESDDPEPAALSQQAQHVGVALDIWSSSRGELAPDVTPAVLEDAGVTVGDDVRVTDFATVRSGGIAGSDDLWQFCLVDADGNWVSYGDRTAVQDFGEEGDAACTFTGGTHPDPPVFDVRGLAPLLEEAMRAVDADDQKSLLVWGNGDTSGRNPKLTALVQDLLPDGWSTSGVDQRGYGAAQYCITAPTGEWYYVHHPTVEEYDDVGRCRLDPDMRSIG